MLLLTSVWEVPSAFMVKISSLPVRFDVKAIRVPSGDQAGWESEPGSLVTSV